MKSSLACWRFCIPVMYCVPQSFSAGFTMPRIPSSSPASRFRYLACASIILLKNSPCASIISGPFIRIAASSIFSSMAPPPRFARNGASAEIVAST